MLFRKDTITKKEAMFLCWWLAVSRRVSILRGDTSKEDWEDLDYEVEKTRLNLNLLLKNEGWDESKRQLSQAQRHEILLEYAAIYKIKYDEVDLAATEMWVAREELKEVGSFGLPPIKHKTNLFDGKNFLNSFED